MLFVVANLNVRIYITKWFLLRATIKWLKDSLLPFVGFFHRLLEALIYLFKSNET